jgi:hypothetical protein
MFDPNNDENRFNPWPRSRPGERLAGWPTVHLISLVSRRSSREGFPPVVFRPVRGIQAALQLLCSVQA